MSQINAVCCNDTGWFGSKLVKKAGGALTSVVKTAAKYNPVTRAATIVSGAAVGAARGQSIGTIAGGVYSATAKPYVKAVSSPRAFLGAVKGALPAAIEALKMSPYGAAASAALSAMQAGLQGRNLAAIAEAAARGAIPTNILAAVDLSRDVLKGRNIARAALERVAGTFAPGSLEQAGFNAAKLILLGGNPSQALLAAARSQLKSEGSRAAFDSAIGTASSVAAAAANTAAPRLANLPRSIANLRTRVTTQFVPLTPRAAQAIATQTPSATMASLWGRADTAGLTADGASYVVEAGEGPYQIATKLVQSGARWKELLTANPAKPISKSTGSFVSLAKGETIKLPLSWIKQVAPIIKRDVIGQARVILITWGATDGKNQAGIAGYTGDDGDTWGPKDRFQLLAFANWREQKTGKSLTKTGALDDQMASELRAWAHEHADWHIALTPDAAPAAIPAAPVPSPAAIPAAPVPSPAAAPAAAAPAAPAATEASVPLQNPLSGTRSVPADISALAAAAQSSGSPAMMRKVAADLRAKGWTVEASLLEASAAKVEQTQGQPGADVNALAAAAQSSGNPATMRQVAQQLRAKGYATLADKLEASAAAIENQSVKDAGGGDAAPLLIGAAVIAKLAGLF
jgi:hypothetical protein